MNSLDNHYANHFWFTLLIALLFVEGCVMLPIPTGDDKVLAGRKISEEQLSPIRPGITTKKEVVERLGEPTVIWEDERIFAYNWQMRWGILFVVAGGHGAGYAGAVDIANKYVLLIRFAEPVNEMRHPPFGN